MRRLWLPALAVLSVTPSCTGCAPPWEADDPWAAQVVTVRPYELCAENLEDFPHLDTDRGDTICLVDFDGTTDWSPLSLVPGDCIEFRDGERDVRQDEPDPSWAGSPPDLTEESDNVWVPNQSDIRVSSTTDCPE